MKRKILFATILLVIVHLCSFSQTDSIGLFRKNAFDSFDKLKKIPYEKLYLQLDKPYFSAGENIWYSGYLFDGFTSLPSPYSRYLYVELINKSDSVLIRQKIAKDSLGFNGNMTLAADFPEGDYKLRAYSWWMQNAGNNYFFQKNIHIGNAIDKSIKSEISLREESDNSINADITFSSDNGTVFGKRYITYNVFDGAKLIKNRITKIDEQGHLQFGFQRNKKSDNTYSIQVILDNNDIKYKKTFYLPDSRNDFDCQFFPEGGLLLNNGLRNIAFKAIGRNGLSVEVTGKIFTESGDTVSEFQSINKGMGTFSLNLTDDIPHKYFARVRLAGSDITKQFALPTVSTRGVGLNLINYNNRIYYHINSAEKKPDFKQTYYILVHEGQHLLMVNAITDSTGWTNGIKTTNIPSGIVHFVLLDKNKNALSDRITFILNPQKSKVDILTDKDVYGKRDKVNFDFSLNTPGDSIVAGKFSVSVTDDKLVKTDSLSDNIYTSLLLTSDLKGYVEDPAFYFTVPNQLPKLDFVMLTQGWTRFDVPEILQNKIEQPKYFLERGQSISGRITNWLGKGSKNAQILALGSKKSNIFKMTTSDNSGHFVLDGLNFQDSTTFIVQALSKGGHKSVGLDLDKEIFPSTDNITPFPSAITSSLLNDYMENSSNSYFNDGGMRIYHLKEVTVTGNKQGEDTNTNPMYAGLGNPIKGDDLEKRYSGMNLLNVVSMMPGVRFDGQKLSVRGSLHGPVLILDDIPYGNDDDDITQMLSSLTVEQISSINLLKGPDAGIVRGGGNGAIIVYLKSGEELDKLTQSPGLGIITPLGLTKPAQFYSPKYETPVQKNNQTSDLRTTIYWNPAFIVEKGKPTHLDFYTADKPGTYTLTLEGITTDGEPIHEVSKIRVR